MTKFFIQGVEIAKVAYNYVWIVEAQNFEEAEAKVRRLMEEDDLPYSTHSNGNSAEVKFVEDWWEGLDSDGLEFRQGWR
jgi:hypothetical protein